MAEFLAAQGSGVVEGGEDLARACVPLAQQWYLQRRIASPESASVTIMTNAVRLAEAAGLLVDDPGVGERRASVAAALREVVASVGVVRRAGLLQMTADEEGP